MDHAEKKCLSSHLASDWINLRVNHATRGSYVTCCKTSLPWVGKTRDKYSRFCCKSRTALYSLQQIWATCNKLNSSVGRQIWKWLVKRATSLFNSFDSNVAKQVASFCCPHYRIASRNSSFFFKGQSSAHAWERTIIITQTPEKHTTNSEKPKRSTNGQNQGR